MAVAQVTLAQLLGPSLEVLYLCDRLVQRQRFHHARREQPAPEDRLAVQMDNELHTVLEVVCQLVDMAHPGHHQIVGGPVPVGDAEEGVHHLELQFDGPQVKLRLLPELGVLVDRRLDLGQRLRHHRLGQPDRQVLASAGVVHRLDRHREMAFLKGLIRVF